jgi:5-methylcytosine-specific restriction enzyme A
MGLRSRFPRHSKAAIRGPRWKALRLATLRRDDFRCVQCGASGRLEVDHIEPVREAPERAHDPDNLQSLCPVCHARKTRAEVGLGPADPNRAAWRKTIMELMTNA